MAAPANASLWPDDAIARVIDATLADMGEPARSDRDASLLEGPSHMESVRALELVMRCEQRLEVRIDVERWVDGGPSLRALHRLMTEASSGA